MKRMRQICDRWTEEDVQYLSHFGIKAKVGYMYFNIEEDDHYFEIRKHFEERWKPLLWSHDSFHYGYSKEEMEASEYFVIKGSHCCGYPQPDWNFKYESVSFDAEKICPECGCGRVQTNDLRVNKVSKHGFWTFFSWLIDEFFVSEKVYSEVFAPYGVEKRDVIKGGKVLEDVFQLVIPIIDESLDLSDRQHWLCPVCGEMKYDFVHKDYPFFPLHKHPLPGIYKTKEYFGAGQGHQAQRVIILSKDVVDKLLKSKDLKKEWLSPCRRESDDTPSVLPHK